ncbi:zf-HC2 domain-containing protein [Streptomyces sp. VRA16 Mangrove soil]|uniref:zf-HC2 domain-containing protein n=1 Tax=Streptomyces sp. VRA16 Mangrove soil TaxID=2817434 RepID=UPI001A9CCBE6|nr:zf-HC2 domain-containing protein [Streptomyces sp. VRA16 Mangrove soil]MBO1332057.1 zf-HC2 domain-containing protein [Streptomyces sp. VRA16 Mangrove soil]
MRSLERHRDAGAYALGVLDPADRFRFEDHLVECVACAAYVGEMRPTTGLLAMYARATPPCVEWCVRPAPTLVERAVDRLGRLHRRARRRLWSVVAVLALLVTAAGAGTSLLRPSTEPAGLALHGRDPGSGVAATLTADERGWGSQIALDVRDPGGPRQCELVAVGRDGKEQTVASWAVDGDGPDRAEVAGGTAQQPDDIARFEVRAIGGGRLLSLPVPPPS